MPLGEPNLRRYLLAMQREWAVLFGGLGFSVLVAAIAGRMWSPPLIEAAATVFFSNAFLNIGAIAWAFAMQHRLRSELLRQLRPEARLVIADKFGRRAIMPLTAAGLFACGAVVATGQYLNLAFFIPSFGYCFLFFPTTGRVERHLDVPSYPPDS